jgi:site-specific recombinase XerD
MTQTDLQVMFKTDSTPSKSPYRLLDANNIEVSWANDFLDLQRVRGLSIRSLRTYAFDLLHFARWWRRGSLRSLTDIDESTLLDYVRDQLDNGPQPSARTINHRLTVVRCLCRFHGVGDAPPSRFFRFGHVYRTRSPLGFGRSRRAIARFRLKQPRRLMIPLSSEEVRRFWRSFRTFRDLSLVALMLFDGLRSQELLDMDLESLRLDEAQIRIRGKGDKERVLPLPAETLRVIRNYLQIERPLANTAALFVCLKGRHRGQPMTPAGLRSLFRHHRRTSGVPKANPHRFRHTFGNDMVRAGVSLPALMRLMGHAHIQTTMTYVQLSPEDVWLEYARAVRQRVAVPPAEIP